MPRLFLCLLAAAVLAAGCGSSDNGSPTAPKSQKVPAVGGKAQPAAVAALPTASVTSLCAAEGRKAKKGKPPFKACVAGLKKLKSGLAKNPRAACNSLSRHKTKGTRGKSPFAVCTKAAAVLMAARRHSTGGSANGNSGGSDASADDSSGDGTLTCFDEEDNEVSADDPNVVDCIDSSDDTSSADDASAGDSSADDSSDNSSDSSGDSSDDSSNDSP